MKRHISTLIMITVVLLVADIQVQAQSTSVTDGIRVEAMRANQSPEGRPLPLLSHWTTGKHPLSKGWAPKEQMQLIEQGHYILPWFEFPDPVVGIADIGPVDQAKFSDYYESAIKKARDLKLPLVFVSSEWERFLYQEPYLSLPPSTNPNVVTPDGKVLPMVSPFGPIEPWQEVGRKLTDNLWMRKLQEWYPDPPFVLFLSNNEHARLTWKNAEQSARYLDMYGAGRDANFKRSIFAEGWIARSRAMQESMRAGLMLQTWKSNSKFVGYNAFGPPHFARWGEWLDYSLYKPGRIDPNPLIWDGGSPSYYVPQGETTDYIVFSPQVEFMNLVFMQDEALKLNPNLWLEISVWDGYEPSNPTIDKRTQYLNLGQTYSPQRYAGMAQFGMWLLRPRAVREFRSWLFPWDQGQPYFMALADAVDRVHKDPTLREWWRTGELVPNRAHQHPYQDGVPDDYANRDRWFLLDSDANPSLYPWKLSTEINVFALALVKGVTPSRQWLVYAHSPLGDRRNVRLTVSDSVNITVDVAVGGSFYLISENPITVEPVPVQPLQAPKNLRQPSL